MPLHTALAVAWRPSAPAITWQGTPCTYAELALRARRAAGWLAGHGLGRGDRIALQLPRGTELIEILLGALSLGVTVVPLNPTATAAEVERTLEDARPCLASLMVDVRTVPHVAPADLRADLDAASERWPDPAVGDGDVALLGYTSGTTGRPKGAPLTHANIAATVEALHQAWRWTSEDVLVHALPLFHIHGLIVAQLGALRAGAHALWLPRFDPHGVLDALEGGGTVLMGVPTFYTRLLETPGAWDLSRVRLFTSGSAPLPARVHRAFAERFGHAILERYGMTEIGIVLSNPYVGERVPGSVGFPLPGVEARVVDGDDRPVPDGTIGEVQIRGPSVFGGYLDRPDATRAALAGGWMHTGDLGHRDAEGRYFLVGRRNDLILSGGLNVYPAEVEGSLREHPDVAEVAVVGLPDPDLGERVAAVVVPVPGAVPSIDDLEAFVRGRLAPYKLPRRWRLAEALPRNAMGKVLHARVRQLWDTEAPTAIGSTAPATEEG